MNTHEIAIEDAAAALLGTLKPDQVDRPAIEEKVRLAAVSMGVESEEEIQAIVRRLEERFDINMELGTLFSADDYRPWLDDARGSIDWYYSERYRRYLKNIRFPPRVVLSMDSITDKLLDHLEDPRKAGAWRRKGMVVGYVQSGKTANYIGLMNKAADSGYRVIIVLAGMLNSLRNQTQTRIDDGFIGIDTESRRKSGVGEFAGERRPAYFTTRIGDFNKAVANQVGVGIGDLREPVVFVIKKNYRTFENLIEWLVGNNPHNLQDYPMLLIDDEADHASINTNKKGFDPTTINSKIRDLLQLFGRSSYVGYTATPFANVFIDPDTKDEMFGHDLFPRDFIISLDPPDNYIGPDHIFSENGSSSIIREVNDYGDLLPLKHKMDWEFDDVPESVKEAVLLFVLSRALRILRGDTSAHNSMMINVSRFTRVQTNIKLLVNGFLNEIRNAIINHCRLKEKLALENQDIAAIKELFEREFGNLDFEWSSVQKILKDAVSPISVIEVNSSSTSEPLNYNPKDYPNGRNVVAVGGLSLSRGMTLEGLTVSYFLRNSIMYDTLMQMGRWFGYRDGYSDLCRIYMSPEAASWYTHISRATEELRSEFKRMKDAGMTPSDFGLCVRSHPESLIVTARNKMRTGTPVLRQISLEGRLIETSVLLNIPTALDTNLDLLKSVVAELNEIDAPLDRNGPRGYFWSNVPAALVKTFINGFRNHPAAMLTSSAPVLEYLERLRQEGSDSWSVLLPSLAREARLSRTLNNLEINLPQRRISKFHDSGIEFNQLRIGEAAQESAGLSENEIKQAKHKYSIMDPPKSVPGAEYRRIRAKTGASPLLVLHLVDCRLDGASQISRDGVAAYGISFPGEPGVRRPDRLVEYMVNLVWWKNEFEHLVLEDDDLPDE